MRRTLGGYSFPRKKNLILEHTSYLGPSPSILLNDTTPSYARVDLYPFCNVQG